MTTYRFTKQGGYQWVLDFPDFNFARTHYSFNDCILMEIFEFGEWHKLWGLKPNGIFKSHGHISE